MAPHEVPQDIDLVVSASSEQVRSFLGCLPKSDYYFDLETAREACRRRDMFNILDMRNGWKMDVIFQKLTPYGQLAFQRRAAALIAGVSVFAATAEDVIDLENGKGQNGRLATTNRRCVWHSQIAKGVA
jgi:hypothetical protein